MCGDCHMSRNKKGEPIKEQWLKGQGLSSRSQTYRPMKAPISIFCWPLLCGRRNSELDARAFKPYASIPRKLFDAKMFGAQAR